MQLVIPQKVPRLNPVYVVLVVSIVHEQMVLRNQVFSWPPGARARGSYTHSEGYSVHISIRVELFSSMFFLEIFTSYMIIEKHNKYIISQYSK